MQYRKRNELHLPFVFIFKKIFALSHAAERKEKNCLNCGTMLHGRFCHVCGQENVVPKETFGKLILHFFYDMTHFDTKFFVTLKDLLFKPGFLSTEYLNGRRVRYLNPVRMYLFTSAIFFLIFFSLQGSNLNFQSNVNKALTSKERDSAIIRLQERLLKDSGNIQLKESLNLLRDTNRAVTVGDIVKESGSFVMMDGVNAGDYKSVEQYDSIQKKKPADQRDGWVTRSLMRKGIELSIRYKHDPSGAIKEFVKIFLHKLPYLLFVSLPLFALILKLLYIRRKQFFYADHGIFTLHHYIFSFILLLFFFGFNGLNSIAGWKIFTILAIITIILWPVYLLIAMKNFYRQRWMKTFLKFLLLNFLGFISLLLLFVFFLFFSFIQL